jgi:excisionase family DNA binding protein
MPSHYARSAEYPLQVHHVVKMLGVCERTVRNWAKSGRLKAIKNGPKIWCFRRSDVEQLRCELQAEGARGMSKSELLERGRFSTEAAFNRAPVSEVAHEC